MQYSHTQTSHMWMWIVGAFEAAAVGLLLLAGAGVVEIGVVIALAAVLTIVGIVFSRLTVEVDDAAVRLAFGSGWPKKSIPWSEVMSARRVRNRWWYGFGMRKIPGGWMWNVGGLDAVELRLDTGKVFRIGTDDPDGLLAACTRRTAAA